MYCILNLMLTVSRLITEYFNVVLFVIVLSFITVANYLSTNRITRFFLISFAAEEFSKLYLKISIFSNYKNNIKFNLFLPSTI